MGNGGQVMQFWKVTLHAIRKNWLPLSLMLLPPVGHAVLGKRFSAARLRLPYLPAFAALYWKKATKAGILSGMAAGFSVTIFWKLIGLPFGIGATVPGAIACALALVLVSLATYKKAPTPFLDPYAKQKEE